MARKASAASGTASSDPRRAAVEALMLLAAEHGWEGIELPEIAREAGLTLTQLRELYPSRGAMLGGLARIVDAEVLAGASSDLDAEPLRERLFDVVMRRLDALTPYKPGLKRIVPAIKRDPLALAALNGVALNSWRYMLASANIPTEDAMGAIRVQGAVLLFSRVMDVWLKDDEAELSKTMAALDRELKRAGQIMARAEDFHRLTAPLRGLASAICSRAPSARRRERAGEGDAAPVNAA
ncbi:MAG: TetR/AcrR family transcriptional regulator [Bosea sp. (in: a-proteobacteria)]